LLDRGDRLDDLQRRVYVNDEVHRDWNEIEANLRMLSDAYGLRWWR
jgi:hypothetical protein